MNNEENNNNNKRYLGKVKESMFKNNNTGQQFTKHTIMVDNPNPLNGEGQTNPYYNGSLLWFDAKTGKYYQIKQIELAGVDQKSASRGYINSLRIDLDNTYHVQAMD